MRRSKKPLIALLVVALVGVIGVTIAYFTDVIEFPNIFKTKPYSTKSVETFVSPDNWLPGTTTEKKVVATNLGDVDVAVRVSYTETWIAKNGTTLPLKQGSVTAAVINFDNTSDWVKSGNYYYYKKKLSKNQSSNSFIKSVTFNKDVVSEPNCTTSANGLEKSCLSTGTKYDDATYTLKIKVETVQFDSYKDAWSTSVSITG